MRYGDFTHDDLDYGYGDSMSIAASSCSKFARRHDFCAFDMSDYCSCENCKHMTAEDQCELKRRDGFNIDRLE